jgi:hypothetical protein
MGPALIVYPVVLQQLEREWRVRLSGSAPGSDL